MSNETMRTPADVRERVVTGRLASLLDADADWLHDEAMAGRLPDRCQTVAERIRAALRSGAQGEEDAVRRTWELAVQRAYGCLDYCGGYRGAELKAFHSGIKTVIRALEAGLDTVDTQTAALDRIGAALRSEASEQGSIHPDPETWRCRQCGGYAAHYRDCPALRSEAQGEGWQVTEPARDIVRREMSETRATVREAIRAARRGEGGGDGE